MTLYWLVSDDHKGPLALVKCSSVRAQLVAGSDQALKSFKDGKPDLFINESWYFEPVAGRSCFPVVGDWIDKLGPPESAQTRLKREREIEKRRARTKNLTNQEISKIRQLRKNGVVLRKIAEKFELSESVVRRLVSGVCGGKTRQPKLPHRVPVQNELEAA